MSSPITLSGFNQIDFSMILNAIMQQERQPVTLLETQKSALEAQKTGFGTLASKLSALETAVENVARVDALRATTATVSDASRLGVSADPTAPAGTYSMYVDELARAEVTTSQQSYADKDTTLVAGAGTLTFSSAAGSVDVTLTGDVTLEQLAAAINSTEDAPVVASIYRNTSGEYALMLTGTQTGADNGFTVNTSQFKKPNGQGGGSPMNFAEIQAAQDAQVRLNGVTATSATNTFDGVISGLSFTVLKEDVTNPVTVTISASYDSVINLVQKLVSAFNDTTKWIGDQTAAAANRDTVGRDPLVRGLRAQLTRALSADAASGGSYTNLAEIGFEFERNGEVTLNETMFREALASNRVDVEGLFRGADGSGGVFGGLATAIGEYTRAGGLVPNAQNRVTAQIRQLSDRIGDMEERLALRRVALQREFAAADATLAQLNSQKGSLSSLGGQFSLF
jgi:flagellar hook-associated protein 2